MVTFKDLAGDSSRSLDLGKEVEKLRLKVALLDRGYLPPEVEDPISSGYLAEGFERQEDFEIREDTATYENGDSYAGEMLGPLRHGRGRHSCSNGDWYEGQWAYDRRHGRGRLRLTSGIDYEGEWKGDKTDGQGRCRYPDGGTYTGEFRDDVRRGWGEHLFASGERYEGEWEGDAQHGRGVLRGADGATFEGEWRDGSRVRGRAEAADGSWSAGGEWNDAGLHGRGFMARKGVDKYQGEWRDGARHGRGECWYAGGGYYVGDWRDGSRHGLGKLFEPGRCYEGAWEDDQPHGVGVEIRGDISLREGGGGGRTPVACPAAADGRAPAPPPPSFSVEAAGPVERYVGGFLRGVRAGRGRLTLPDGTRYEGDFSSGVRRGQGTCRYANGDRYRGSWLDDRRHGRGRCKFADGTRFDGEWEGDCWVQSEADASKCRLAGAGLVRALAGKPAEFRIQARDEAGVRRLDGGDEFKVVLLWDGDGVGGRGASTAAAAAAAAAPAGALASAVVAEPTDPPPTPPVIGSVTDLGDGSYSASYRATKAGVYRLHVTDANGEAVADSPYPVRVEAGTPNARRSEVVLGPRGRRVEVGRPITFHVILRDALGNACDAPSARAALPLKATLTTNGGEVDAEAVGNGDSDGDGDGESCSGLEGEPRSAPGHLAFRYSLPTIGLWRLHVDAFPPDGSGGAATGRPVALGSIGGAGGTPLPGTPLSIVACPPVGGGGPGGAKAGAAGAAASPKADAASVAPAPETPPQGGSGGGGRGEATGGAARPARPLPSDRSSPDPAADRIEDESRRWAAIAKDAFRLIDGDERGWESDEEAEGNAAAEAASTAGPGVPVVENLEDMWLVTKLQREREEKKAKAEAERRLKILGSLERAYGEPEQVDETARVGEVRHLIEEDTRRRRERAVLGLGGTRTAALGGPASPGPLPAAPAAASAAPPGAASPGAAGTPAPALAARPPQALDRRARLRQAASMLDE